jgi:hypothetical protein
LASLLPILGVAVPVNVALFAGQAVLSAPAGAQTGGNTSYSVGTAQVTTITNGTSAAPWNTSQGDTNFASYASQSPGTLTPVYTPGGATENVGGVTEPNLAVYPASDSGTDGDFPYPSGTVGTPGPLTGYCGTGNNTTASSGSPTRQPASTTLPFSPAYFPHIVRNADGSLTGYFDYRPKDADEAIVAAKSTDNGKDWTYEGEALEQNPGYCPSADINDDGQGHPNVLTIGGTSDLYTLQRPAGDNVGVGMLVHALDPTSGDPLNGAPATEKVGIDPDAFATNTAPLPIPFTGGTPVAIPLNSTGLAGSPEQLIASSGTPGSFVDLTSTSTPNANTVIKCTGTTATSLTGCTTTDSAGLTITQNDLIEQVIGTTTGSSGTVPAGPNTTAGDGGLSSIGITFATNGNSSTSVVANILNANAPNRLYLNGVAIYCAQSNASPTTKIENCTTGPGNSALNYSAGSILTSDPIVPSTATAQTNGLVSPDGIVGILPSYPGLPSGDTAVMYTEKILNYYEAGVTTNGSATKFNTNFTLSFTPSASFEGFSSQGVPSDMPSPSSVTSGSPVTVYIGDITNSSIVAATCTGETGGTTTATLTGCNVPVANQGDSYNSTSFIGAPGAAITSNSTLGSIGEGAGASPSAKNVAKLMKNNEDLSILRVAYTSDGINFSDSGLANSGVISGQSNGASNYTDITNPSSQVSPSNLNAYATPGTADATEMRWVGSAGSIITNPDGSYGLFLSGSWAADGDSDAFNQIFYSSSTDGENWTIPVSVVSTDYTFSASSDQDTNGGPLGISAYYSGRAYGPSVVQNPDGSLTMVFAGYRLPKPIESAGTVLGTNPSDLYTVGTSDPALYRNIMVVTLQSATSPAVSTTTSLATSDATPAVGEQVTYTATVSPVSPGTGTPTGTVTFTGDAGTLCTTSLDDDASDQATCNTTYEAPGSDSVTATYNSDANYATSTSNTITETIPLESSTTTSSPGSASVVLGSTNADIAIVTGSGSADPTGSISFYECAPGTTPCNDTTGTLVNSVDLSGTSNPDSVTSADVTPDSTGDWCFAALYSGDSNYSASSDTTSDECFDVTQGSSSTTSAPGSSAITLGDTNDDSATVTGDVGSVDPTGSVGFYECAPGTSPCNVTTGTLLNSVDLSGSSNPETVTSADIAPDSTGDWCFAAVYSGDANYTGSSDTTSDECFSVNKGSSTTTSEPVSSSVVLGGSDSDNATVTGSDSGVDPTGSVTFYYCGPEGPETGCTSTSGTEFDTESLSGSANPGTVTSADFKPPSAGDWCFGALYGGDSSYTASSDTSTDECFTVDVTGSTTSSTPASGTITLGGSDSDSATVTGSLSGVDPSGSVDFYECGPDTSATPCSSGTQTLFDTEALDGTSNPGTVDSASFTPTSAGHWCFEAVYSGDTDYAGSSDDSIDECFTVGQGTSSTVSTPSDSPIVLGNAETDSASVTGSDGPVDPTGSVTFYECGPGATSCSSTTGTEFDTETLSIGNPAAASSAGFLPTSAGKWCFAAVYSGDANYAASTDSTSDECFTVKPAVSTSVSKPSTTGVVLKTTVYDTVTVTGNTAGGAPTGRVTFYECGPEPAPQNCTDQADIVGTAALAPSAGDVSTAKSPTVKPTVAGWYCFAAYYSGDSNYDNSSDTTTDECFDAGSAPTITRFSPTSGNVGVKVTVNGTNLNGATSVTLDGTAVKILTDTATKITFKVPTGAKTGTIKVVTQISSVISKTKFKVT